MKYENIDEEIKPYADFLEEICKSCAENQFIGGAFIAKTKDGMTYSAYFGDADESPYEKMFLANVAQSDGMFEISMANADQIVNRAKGISEEEEEIGDFE